MGNDKGREVRAGHGHERAMGYKYRARLAVVNPIVEIKHSIRLEKVKTEKHLTP